jgi:hypothetical protein
MVDRKESKDLALKRKNLKLVRYQCMWCRITNKITKHRTVSLEENSVLF